MKVSQIILCVLSLLLVKMTPVCRSATPSRFANLSNSVFDGYNTQLLPVVDNSSSIQVGIGLALVSLNDFEIMSGMVDITLGITATWRDFTISWTPSDFDGIQSFATSAETIWKPQIALLQSAEKIQYISNTSLMPRIFYDGKVMWYPSAVLKITCSVDVTYLPYDTQVCQVRLSSTGYLPNEVNFYATTSLLSLDQASENSQWEVLPSKITSCTGSGLACISMELVLKRRTEFYIVYLIIPILMLGVITNFVFFMPANCGERTSVAITTLLSFVVYMSIVNDIVPESSSPMCILYYYLLFLMFYSSFTIFACIISLRLYDKTGEVPRHVGMLVYYLRFDCVKQKRRSREVSPELESVKGSKVDLKDNTVGTEDNSGATVEGLTWTEVGKTFDFCTACFLYLVFAVITMSILIVLQNAGKS